MHRGFQYGFAKSRAENPRVMEQVDKTHGSWGCGPDWQRFLQLNPGVQDYHQHGLRRHGSRR